MNRRYQTGPFKFEKGDMVIHEVCRIRGKIIDMGWADDPRIKGTSGNHVRIYLVETLRRRCAVWLSESLLKRVSPLILLAECAE